MRAPTMPAPSCRMLLARSQSAPKTPGAAGRPA